MLVTNYSDQNHTYREPQAGGARFRWSPGESKDVPDSIGRLLIRMHPSKFIPPSGPDAQSNPEDYVTTEAQPDSDTEMRTTPSSRRRRNR